MSRLLILPALLIGLPLIGCSDAPPQALAPYGAALPVADAQVTPTGSHVRGAAPDPMMLTVTPGEVAAARPYGAQNALNYSRIWPFANISGY
jgi:hypothetical protein